MSQTMNMNIQAIHERVELAVEIAVIPCAICRAFSLHPCRHFC